MGRFLNILDLTNIPPRGIIKIQKYQGDTKWQSVLIQNVNVKIALAEIIVNVTVKHAIVPNVKAIKKKNKKGRKPLFML